MVVRVRNSTQTGLKRVIIVHVAGLSRAGPGCRWPSAVPSLHPANLAPSGEGAAPSHQLQL